MDTFTIEAIKDFQTCALLYDYRHVQDMYEPIPGRDLLTQRFDNTIKKIVAFFFYKKQAGIIPSYSALLNRWERLWFPKDMDAYDIAVEQHESAWGNMASFTTDAAAALLSFHEIFSEDAREVVLLDEEFTVPVGPDIRFEGSIDLVLRDKKKDYTVVKWSAANRRPTVGSVFLDFAFLKYAFDYRNNRLINAVYGVYDLTSGSPGFMPIDVNEEDINALIYWTKEARETDIFMPRRGLTYYCKRCPFDKPCANFALTTETLVAVTS